MRLLTANVKNVIIIIHKHVTLTSTPSGAHAKYRGLPDGGGKMNDATNSTRYKCHGRGSARARASFLSRAPGHAGRAGDIQRPTD